MSKNVKHPEHAPPEWNLGDWEENYTIQVGTAYLCRKCENLVMVTRGGIGVLDLECCGRPMLKVETHLHEVPREEDEA